MSFGLDKHRDDIEDKLRTLRRCGSICVASAGNDGKIRPNAVTFPGTCGDVICVSANDSHGCLANFSPVGQEIKCLAPGVKDVIILLVVSLACHILLKMEKGPVTP